MRKTIAILVFTVMILTSLPLGTLAQNPRQSDPRGLNRYTLTGERTDLSVFTIERYNGSSSFFDGFGRKTANELGLTGAEFWNEFGREVRKGYLHSEAVIRFMNGFVWDEAYLEGCLVSGQVFYNRIKIVGRPQTIKPTPLTPPKELCINIPLAVVDVPPDWTIKMGNDGNKSCHYPVVQQVVYAPPEIVTKQVCTPGSWVDLVEKGRSAGKLGDKFKVRDALSGLSPEIQSQILSQIKPEKANYILIQQGACEDEKGRISVRWFVKGGGWNWFSFAVGIGSGIAIGYVLKRSLNDPEPLKYQPAQGIPSRIRY